MKICVVLLQGNESFPELSPVHLKIRHNIDVVTIFYIRESLSEAEVKLKGNLSSLKNVLSPCKSKENISGKLHAFN